MHFLEAFKRSVLLLVEMGLVLCHPLAYKLKEMFMTQYHLISFKV